MATEYDFSWAASDSMDPTSLPESGTLEEAIEAAKSSGAECKLLDKPGFVRGWVHPDGTYSLQ